MSGRTALILTAAGLLVGLASGLADVMGLGQHVGFGPRQTTGVILGAVVFLVGLVAWLRAHRRA